MIDAIQDALSMIEREYGVRILYSCESGSRAWGIASPNSDYDVRFIYAHPEDWYLNLQEQRDVIQRDLPGDLDVSAWDVRKALKLFASCNLGYNEWFASPIVYRDDEHFAPAIRELIPRVFNPKSASFHYYKIAVNTEKAHPIDGPIKVKKLFYILRPLLACEWIARNQTMSPTEIDVMLDAGLMPDDVLSEVRALRDAKASLVEEAPVQPHKVIVDWIKSAFPRANANAHEIKPGGEACWDELNALFKQVVRGG